MALRKKKEVIKYVSNHPDLQEWIRDFSRHLKTHPEENVVVYPESFAKGYAKVFELAKGLTCRIVDYTLNTDFLFERPPSPDFYLILYFYNYRHCHRLDLEINGRKVIENEDADYSSLLMTNSFASQALKVTKNTRVQGITIQLTQDWISGKMRHSSKVNLGILQKKDVFQTLIRPSYQVLINQIFEPKPNTHLPELYQISRVMKLLEIFFDQIFKNGLEANVLPASSRDVQNIVRVEQYLLQNYREQFPTINTLARMAMMSSSKLKQTFKKAFGISIFEYFQKNRMHKAKDLLKSGVYSVTEVGQLLGYHNLSNFTTAFKKEFKVLPKDYDQLS